ncbi:endolytic transglycosylase MltG [Candidatus Wolfebacteria bacterium]|nr:endolytic transglycosylase MltG [Candidatus Wolfebacteria bacterium]
MANNKYFKLILIIFVIIALVAGVSFSIFLKNLYSDAKISNYPIFFEISYGMGLNEITDILYSSKLIRSKIVFKIYVMVIGAANKLQAGSYETETPISIPNLVDILKSGPQEIEAVIFPGMTLKEIDDRFSELKIIKQGSLIYYQGFDKLKNKYQFLESAKNLEGYLFPDTYRFYKNSNADFVIDKILSNFKSKIDSLIFQNSGIDLKKILIIASMLEKEAPGYEDRRLIAGIMEKRLKVGMPLQIDASVIYAKCSGRFIGCPALEGIDFKFDSEYNTYYYKRLTPTPIGNPDLEAIKASIEKKDSRYWYYLSDPKTKKTIFSVDLDEHNKNRAKYLLLNKK